MSKLYPVQEIGSLAKPRWRTKGLTQPLLSKDLVEAEEWAQRLGIPDFQDRAKQLLAAQQQNDRVRELLELSTIYGLRLFEQTGLDNVGVGGEQQRVEMYEHVIRGVEGMRVLGHVQSFDYKYDVDEPFVPACVSHVFHDNLPVSDQRACENDEPDNSDEKICSKTRLVIAEC